MTPLAQQVALQLTLPKAQRTLVDPDKMLMAFSDVHCFDLTAVKSEMERLDGRFKSEGSDPSLAFLPAAKTWIEFEYRGERSAYLLLREKDGQADMYAIDGLMFAARRFRQFPIAVRAPSPNDSERKLVVVRFIAAALTLINSPRDVGRRTHAPDKALEARMLAAQKVVGKFPLHAWTEITLPVGPPKDHAAEAPIEAHLSGRKCLHWVRAFRRTMADGRQIVVRDHWRGDAALGIKRSRYRLTPPPPGTQPDPPPNHPSSDH